MVGMNCGEGAGGHEVSEGHFRDVGNDLGLDDNDSHDSRSLHNSE